jgi:endonuclease/exonuclease/phosphatase family metal-dependent hydrolase
MRVVTLNSWKNEGDYDHRLARMAEGLCSLSADIIALQECFVAPGLGIDTAAELATATGLHLTRRAMRAKSRHHCGEWIETRSDLALLTRDTPITISGSSFPDDPDDQDRGFLSVDIDVGAARIRFASTHLTHLQGEAASKLRTEQTRAAVEHLIEGATCPVVLAGDFNAIPGDRSFAPLLDHPKLDEQSRAAAFAVTISRVSPVRALSGHIDHILLFHAQNRVRFAKRSVALVADHEELHLGPSDHPAIVADLEIL